MKVEDFMELGLNRNEAKVYISLIKFKRADAHKIIQDTKFHKNIVYDNLDKLIDKGLVNYIIEGNKKIFVLSSPDMLVELFNEKLKDVEEKKKQAEVMAKEISKISRVAKFEQEAVIYRGIKGIKTYYKETLEGGDYIVFGAPQTSLDIMGETFWKNYNLKRTEKKIKVKMIFNPSIKKYGEKIKNRYTEIKYFNQDFEPMTETHIQGDKVGILVWSEEPILFFIKDKHVANSYLKFFESMWKEGK